MTRPLLAALLIGLATAGTASAQRAALSGPATEPPIRRERDTGYALALSAAYVAAVAAGGTLLLDDEAVLGTFALLAPAPVVHLAYGDSLWALLSVVGPLTWIALTGLTLLVSSAPFRGCTLTYDDTEPAPCFETAARGSVLGYVAWAIVDVLVSTRKVRR